MSVYFAPACSVRSACLNKTTQSTNIVYLPIIFTVLDWPTFFRMNFFKRTWPARIRKEPAYRSFVNASCDANCECDMTNDLRKAIYNTYRYLLPSCENRFPLAFYINRSCTKSCWRLSTYLDGRWARFLYDILTSEHPHAVSHSIRRIYLVRVRRNLRVFCKKYLLDRLEIGADTTRR